MDKKARRKAGKGEEGDKGAGKGYGCREEDQGQGEVGCGGVTIYGEFGYNGLTH